MEISKKSIQYYRSHPEELKLLKLCASSRGSKYDLMLINEVEKDNNSKIKTYSLRAL